MLKEGEKIDLLIKEEISVEEGSTPLFLLEAQDHSKYLFENKYYRHYPTLYKGNTVSFKIDKISCTGKIYFEPENPFFKENETYCFMVKKTEIFHDIFGQKLYLLHFEEKNYRIIVPNWDFVEEKHYVKWTVFRIKKNIVFANIATKKECLLPDYEEYIVKGSVILSDQLPYYLFENEKFGHYFLKIKSYASYQLKLGQRLNCRHIMAENRIIRIEPEHPYYKPNYCYSFLIKSINIVEQLIVFHDIYTNDILFSDYENRIRHNFNIGDCPIMKVTEIRYGKPVLNY